MKKLLFLIMISHIAGLAVAQTLSYDIRLNQIGFLPNAIKRAAIVNSEADSFKVMTIDSDSIVFRGKCLPAVYYSSSDENVRIADFTLLQRPGQYSMVIDGLGKSVPFTINSNVFTGLSKASIKAYYYNRASAEILEEFAGVYARPAGHPDTSVVVLPSAASAGRPAGTAISTPGGWYDAGDYNKYIVNSGISTFTLLSAYETYPEYFDTLSLNIPESSNSIPDILDEALWNIKWMMSMQDTADGGVYHKTTEAQFSAFSMPAAVTSTRYVTAKGTAATLDFAAIMAMTARIYKKYLPELADTALAQSIKAWQWAKDNPNVTFSNPNASGIYPAIGTGEYGDNNFDDEFSWCAAELYITTQQPGYYSEIGLDGNFDLPGWGNVKTLGLQSLLIHKDSLTAEADTALAKEKLIGLAGGTLSNIVTSAYRIPGDFYYWGGNNAYANWGMLYMQAFRITGNAGYFNAAVSSIDYLLGRNATTYCFVTGAGTKYPMNIHHRISGADGIGEPVPGMLAGGPGTGSISDCGASQYPSTYPARSYADLQCSYSTNEVAINWNAPLAFLTAAIMVEYSAHFADSMPLYFVLSSKQAELPYKKGDGFQIVVEGNTDWSLTNASAWISLSPATGSGSGTFLINSQDNNPADSARTGVIYFYSQGLLADSIRVTQNGIRESFRIEAENYSAMAGLQTETTSDAGGGLNLGYADPDDWATYNIDITKAGVYDVVFRHAGYAGNIDISLNDIFLQNITFAATTDWQDWASYSTQMGMTDGQHGLKLTFNAAGVNLNWMEFDWNSPLKVESLMNTDIIVYPVPTDSYLRIEFGTVDHARDIQILSMEGKTLLQQKSTDLSSVAIDVSELNAGIYFLKVTDGQDIYLRKFIIN